MRVGDEPLDSTDYVLQIGRVRRKHNRITWTYAKAFKAVEQIESCCSALLLRDRVDVPANSKVA